MKKVSFFLSALAMVAFVACNDASADAEATDVTEEVAVEATEEVAEEATEEAAE
jgi:ABC-type metal ion transport system substrate-binding protein